MNGKFTKAADRIEKQHAFKEEQKKLHEKYADPELKDVVIKEKNNIFKFTVNVLRELAKTIFNIAMILLAAVGILSLLHPETRSEIAEILNGIWQDILNLI